MVILPNEAGKLSDKEKKEADIIELSIDDLLKGDGPRTYAVNLFPSRKVREYVVEKYEAAGWNVTYRWNQRDGDYLEFTPASSCD